jgi:SAM-dependent methyltransferase
MRFHYQNEVAVVVQCANCKAAFLSPQPSDAWLSHEYSGYYKRRSTGVQKLENFRRFFKNHDLGDANRILEIGGGEGACARAVLENKPAAQLTVVEAHADAKRFYSDIHCQLISATLEDWLQTNSERFDLILLFDVLEHVRDPASVLRALRTCLNPGGRIWLSVPAYDSVSRRILGRFWPQYKPEHLFYFSREGLETAFANAGFTNTNLKRHTKYLPLSYLLSVGAGFGPRVSQIIFGALRSFIPAFAQKWMITFCLGERLVQAQTPQAKAVST